MPRNSLPNSLTYLRCSGPGESPAEQARRPCYWSVSPRSARCPGASSMTCHSVSSPSPGRTPDHFEAGVLPDRAQAEVGTGRTAADEYVITSIHDVVRAGDIAGKRSQNPFRRHGLLPGQAAQASWSTCSRWPGDIGDLAVNIPPVDRVDEPDDGRTGEAEFAPAEPSRRRRDLEGERCLMGHPSSLSPGSAADQARPADLPRRLAGLRSALEIPGNCFALARSECESSAPRTYGR